MAALGAGVLLLSGVPPARASDPGSADASCGLFGVTCDVAVFKPPRAASAALARGASTGRRSARPAPPCETVLMQPQPPKSDPVWAGHATDAIYLKICNIGGIHPGTITFWSAAPPQNAPTTLTPAQLAQQALASLRLPKPVLHRSPSESNSDHGIPYTWVHLWTWYWTSPVSWRELSKTASLRGISATVTVTPAQLTWEPGDGQPSVSCAGPGRAWTEADGNAVPSESNGGCGYQYRSVSDQVSPTLSIRWDVAWTSSVGPGGTLPAMTTQTTSPPFKVEQIQVEQIQEVNR
jgi:hypothetical protein